jgi:TPR repeat protein
MVAILLAISPPLQAYRDDRQKPDKAATNQTAGDCATTTDFALRTRCRAEQGDATAQFSLGLLYVFGKTVPQDFTRAAQWFDKAARQGNANAQAGLGTLYSSGRGVPQDFTRAAKWFRKAAEQGDASGQLGLGGLYSDGQGVPQDYVQAHMWFNLAAVHISPKTHSSVIRFRNLIAAKMTPEQIAEAQRLAREWRPKAER